MMAFAAKRMKVENEECSESVSGYLHNVSVVKTSIRNRSKYFNAVVQVSRDEYHKVVVFTAEKRTSFAQAEKNRSPVKLKGIKRRVSSDRAGYDVQCGRATDISVLREVGFSFKEAPEFQKRSVADVKRMAPRQQVGMMEVRVVHVKAATEMVEVRGARIETQTCYVEDLTGRIKIQLWDRQIGLLVSGKTYTIRHVCTREYLECLFLTTTRETEIEEVQALHGPSPDGAFVVQEDEVKTLSGVINAAEIAVSRRCTKCQTWQTDFQIKCKFHRCQKCGLLQKADNYQPIATGKVCLVGDFGEEDLTLSNSVLKKYLEGGNLLHLLAEGQDVEEHLLTMEHCTVNIENNRVVAIQKMVVDSPAESPEHAVAQSASSQVPSASVIIEVPATSMGDEADADSIDEEVAAAMLMEEEIAGMV